MSHGGVCPEGWHVRRREGAVTEGSGAMSVRRPEGTATRRGATEGNDRGQRQGTTTGESDRGEPQGRATGESHRGEPQGGRPQGGGADQRRGLEKKVSTEGDCASEMACRVHRTNNSCRQSARGWQRGAVGSVAPPADSVAGAWPVQKSRRPCLRRARPPLVGWQVRLLESHAAPGERGVVRPPGPAWRFDPCSRSVTCRRSVSYAPGRGGRPRSGPTAGGARRPRGSLPPGW